MRVNLDLLKAPYFLSIYLEDLLRTIKSDENSNQKEKSSLPSKSMEGNTYEDECSESCSSAVAESYIRDNGSDATSYVAPAADQHQRDKESANLTGEDSVDLCKEVRCIEMDESSENKTFESVSLSNTEYGERMSMPPSNIGHSDLRQLPPMSLGQTSSTRDHSLHGACEQTMQDMQNTINTLVRPFPDDSSLFSFSTSISVSKSQKLIRSRSCRANFMVGSLSPDAETVEESKTTPPNVLEIDFPGRPEGFQWKHHWKLPLLIYGANKSKLLRNNSQSSIGNAFVDGSNAPGDEDIPSVDNFLAGLKEMAKLEYDNQPHDQVLQHLVLVHYHTFIVILMPNALLNAILKRVKGFIKLRITLGTLHGALPDTTMEELQTCDDECVICRVGSRFT